MCGRNCGGGRGVPRHTPLVGPDLIRAGASFLAIVGFGALPALLACPGICALQEVSFAPDQVRGDAGGKALSYTALPV